MYVGKLKPKFKLNRNLFCIQLSFCKDEAKQLAASKIKPTSEIKNLVNVSPFLIITAAVWCGFWARHLRCFVDNHTIPSKVDEVADDIYKKVDGETSANHEDRFTQLPNEILSFILTHLTLRDIVRITTLSRQWKNIWSLLSNLDLNWQVMSGYIGFCRKDGCELYRQAYVKRVNKVLQECDSHDISSFRFSFCFTKDYTSHVDRWISFASKKHLESLTLQFVCIDHSASPLNLRVDKPMRPEVMYTITSCFLSLFPCLKNLRLDACTLKLHSDFRFNKLVHLDLYYVFLEENQLQWLLSNSLTIEWLRIRWCNLPKKLYIGDNLHRLSSLMIHDISTRLEIELNAKSLNFFDFVGKATVQFSFLSVAKLESCNLELTTRNYEGAERILRQFATSLPFLETLVLRGLYFLIHVLPTPPSTLFRRVVSLSLSCVGEDAKVDMVKSFPRLLKCFPQLQKLYLVVPSSHHTRTYELPDVCLNTSLKEIELGNFEMDWIPCAIYFLKCAVVLDRMLISCYKTLYTREGVWKRFGNCFSQQECDYIRSALQGNAISPNAELVIQ